MVIIKESSLACFFNLSKSYATLSILLFQGPWVIVQLTAITYNSASERSGLEYLNTSDTETLPSVAGQDARRTILKQVGGVCTSLSTPPLVAETR